MLYNINQPTSHNIYIVMHDSLINQTKDINRTQNR